MSQVTKQSLLALVNDYGTLYIDNIHKMLGINPSNEEDRKAVWRVGQFLAELVKHRFVEMEIVRGRRCFYKKG